MSKQQYRGPMQWLKRLKGFGFIQPDDGSADLYIHYASEDSIKNQGQYHQSKKRR